MTDRAGAHRWLAAAAAVLGVLATAAGDPYPGGVAQPTDSDDVGVIEVARWIRDGNANARLIDIRSDSQFAAYHIPGAEHVAPGDLPRRAWDRSDTVVVYADVDEHARNAALSLRARGAGRVRVLRGGLLTWIDSIAEPRVAPLGPTATEQERAARRDHLELSRYFGGMPLVSPMHAPPGPARIGPLPAGRSEAAAVGRMFRRGC